MLFQSLFDFSNLVRLQPERHRSHNARDLLGIAKPDDGPGDRRVAECPRYGYFACCPSMTVTDLTKVFHQSQIAR